MGECFLYGARGGAAALSGTGLNVLFGGERPETAEPDTIWVSAESDDGAYVLSPDTPEGEEGLVWFRTGDSGVSVAMYNPVQAVFHLMDAQVYRDGNWAPMPEAGVYRDGTWILFCESYLRLYYAGDSCKDITGGYDNGYPCMGVNTYLPKFNSDCVSFMSYTVSFDAMCTKNRFSLGRYSKLVVDWYVPQAADDSPDDTMALTIFDTTKNKIYAELLYGPASVRKTDVLDLSGLDKNKEFLVAVRGHVNTPDRSGALKMTAYLYSLEFRV